jgi:cysteine desulfurase
MFNKLGTQRNRKRGKHIHLDFSSTTPVEKKVLNKMLSFYSKNFFNPSSIYLDAKLVKDQIEDYRSKIANKLQVKSSEIIFTNGGTESINMAILGIVKSQKFTVKTPHIISSVVEHPAVMQTLGEAQRLGAEVTLLKVNEEGLVSVEDLKKELRENTVLITIVYATSETGTIQPIRKIGVEIQKFKERLSRSNDQFPYFHTDASQAALTLDLNVDKLKVDMMTLDGSKIYGPKANGCLVKKRNVEIKPIIFGGGQEKGIRPGTENVSGIVGFCEALLIVFQRREIDKEKFEVLQKYMIEKLESEIPEADINGSIKNRISNNINICIPNTNAEFTVIMMDEEGINCSAGTACKAMSGTGHSYAIEALGKRGCEQSSIRFSFGRSTSKKDIDKAISALRKAIDFQLTNK